MKGKKYKRIKYAHCWYIFVTAIVYLKTVLNSIPINNANEYKNLLENLTSGLLN